MYKESSIDPIKYVVIGLLALSILLGLFLLPLTPGQAQTSTINSSGNANAKPALFSDAIAANTLCSAGLGCANVATDTKSAPQAPSLLGGLFGSSSGPSFDPIISVVNVEGQKEVYRIINGRKHSIPTQEIFYSYGFDIKIVQKITLAELSKYPTARLFIVEGTANKKNPTIYYLTEGGMIRPMLNDTVFYSYGNRKEDVITINQKEFNYYPRDEYVFIERPDLNREVYQITGGVKKYVTPVAVRRLNLKEGQIAPINQIEFDAYPSGEAIIF